MHFTFNMSDMKIDFKKHIISLYEKKILFRYKSYEKNGYSYFIDYENEFIIKAIKYSHHLNYILKLKSETILFFADHLNLQTALFNNHLKFQSSLKSSNQNPFIQKHLSIMNTVTRNILKSQLNISDPSLFLQNFKEELGSYRGHIRSCNIFDP